MNRSYAEFHDGWKVVMAGAIGGLAGITGMLTNSRGILLNPLADAFDWNRTEVSTALSALMAGTIVTAPFVGRLVDRIGARRIGIVSMIVLAFAALAMTQLSGSVKVFAFAVFLMSVCGCGTTPLVWSRGVATWFVQRRGLAIALMTCGTGVSWVITPFYLNAWLHAFDWQGAYVGMALVSALALIPITLFFHENRGQGVKNLVRPDIVDSGIDVATAIRSYRFWFIGIGIMLVAGVVATLTVHQVAMLTDAGVARDTAVNLTSLMGIAIITGRLLPGYLVDRVHPPLVAGIFLAVPAIACAILQADSLSFGAIVVATLAIGITAGAQIDLLPYFVSHYFGLKAFGKIYGLQFVMLYTGSGLAPILMGRVYDTTGGYDLGLWIDIPLVLIGALAFLALGKPPVFETHAKTPA